MDNLPTQNTDGAPGSGSSGEIYSAYDPQGANLSEASQSPEVSGPLPPVDNVASGSGEYPPTEIPPTPPPFTQESHGKKIIIIAGVLIVIGLFIFLAISFIKGRKPAAPKEISLTYWGLFEDSAIFQPILDEYKRSHPNTTISYVKQDPKLYRERLQAALKRGEGPDLFRFHNTWVPMFISNLSPMPKTIYADQEFEKIFPPVATYDLKVSENYYGVPLMIDGLVLYYNEDILKSANVTVPSTWDEVMTASRKLTVKEKGRIATSGIALGTAENIEHFSDILGLMMLQNGVDLNKSLFKCVNLKTTDCAVQVLSFYRSFAESPNNSWDETLDNSILAFASGKAAMMFAPSWQVFTIKSINPNLNFKTAKVPQLPCEKDPCPSVNWATYWVEGVSNISKYPNEAWEFLKYLTQAETMKKLYELEVKQRQLFGEPYSRIDLLNSLSSNIYLAPLIEQVPTMSSFYLASRTQDGNEGINTSFIQYLTNAVNSLSTGVSPETALKTADNGFLQTLTRFGVTTNAK